MNILCHQQLKDPQYYFEHEPARIYVCDLNHQAPTFIKKAKEAGYKVYGSVGRRPTKGNWLATCTTGTTNPKTYWMMRAEG